MERLLGVPAQIATINRNYTGGRVIKPSQQINHGTLARTGWTHEGHHLPLRYVEVYLVQDGEGRVIPEVDPDKPDMPLEGG